MFAMIAGAPAAGSATLSVQPHAVEPGSAVQISGEGMASFEDVILRYDGAILAIAHASETEGFRKDEVLFPESAEPGRRAIAAVGRSSGTLATTTFLVRDSWPQFHRGSFRHGESPHETVLSPGNVAQLQVLWNVPSGLSINFAMQGSPVVANDLVYIITSDQEQAHLLALDAATGVRRWSKRLGSASGSGYSCGATPAVAYGLVFAPVAGRMTAYDARTGVLRWRGGRASCDNPMTPTVADGKVFTVTSSGVNVEARDPISGGLLWNRRVCIGSSATNCAYASIFGPLAAGGGIVYVTNYVGGMAAFEANTGRRIWSRVVGAGLIDSAPVVEGDVVYVSIHDSQLYALDRHTGDQLWAAPTGDYNHSTPALANGRLYVGSDGDGLWAIDSATGAVLWQQTSVATVRTSPAVANGVLYLGGGDGRFYALDAETGAVLYSRQVAPAGRVLSPSPAVANGVVYVGTGDRLIALGLAPGVAETSR